jgi:hypothetical protein
VGIRCYQPQGLDAADFTVTGAGFQL